MRTIISCATIITFLLIGCGKSAEQTELEKKNAELTQDLATKDHFIEDITGTINDIHNKLETTWAMEKKILRQTSSIEQTKNMSPSEMKQQMLDRISGISSILVQNRKQLASLEHRLSESKKEYAGLQEMVADLKKNLEEREKSVAELQTHVQNLESEVADKTQVIATRDRTIEDQTAQLNTVYYVTGKRSELKDKGIITREGGFLWGLLGSTIVLNDDFAEENFVPMDKTKDNSIVVAGTIDEIVPARDKSSYTEEETEDHHTVLKISKPESFWRQKHLVIVTD